MFFIWKNDEGDDIIYNEMKVDSLITEYPDTLKQVGEQISTRSMRCRNQPLLTVSREEFRKNEKGKLRRRW